MIAGIHSRLFAGAVALLALTGAASAEQWRVAHSIGQVGLGSQSAQPASLSPGETIADGATLVTGKMGRVLLVRGKQSMMVGPNSVVTLPEENDGRTTVVQEAGDIIFNVDKRDVRHFAVETPSLAAVVKGTMFQVSVSPGNSKVQVFRGLVEVSNPVTGEFADVPLGQSATVAGPKSGMSIAAAFGRPTEVKQGQAKAAASSSSKSAGGTSHGAAVSSSKSGGKAGAGGHGSAGGNGSASASAGNGGSSNGGNSGNGGNGGKGGGNSKGHS